MLSLDDLDHIYILLDEGNDLTKEITYLFNEVFLISSLKKNTISQVLNIFKTCTVIQGNFEQFQACFLA